MKELKKIYNIIFIFISIIIISIVGLFLINKYFKYGVISNKYVYNGNTDYKVILNDGSISNQKLFVTSTVKNINVNFNYKYSLEKNENIKYHYDITSYVISNLDDNDKENTELYNNSYTLVNKSNTIVSNTISINESVDIDYNLYDEEATKYDNSINVAIKSKLLVKFDLYVDINGEEEKITSYLSMPLEDSTFSITNINGNKTGTILTDSKSNLKTILYMLLLMLSLFSLCMVIYEIIILLKYKKEHILEFKYKKIMSDYNNIVVPINTIPKGENIMCVRVQLFKSMIDIQKELHVPILCYRDDKRIIYLIYSNELVYIYILNSEDEKI